MVKSGSTVLGCEALGEALAVPDVEGCEVAAALVVSFSFAVAVLVDDCVSLAAAFSLAEDTGLSVEAGLVELAVGDFVGDADVEDIGVSVPGDDDAVLDPPADLPEASLLLPWSTDETAVGPFKGFSGG